ncbi:MAG: hypothetical protein Q9168_007173 [Polycauliona sp. 1 TL-2023]
MLGFSIATLLLAAIPIKAHSNHMTVGGLTRSVNVSICDTQGPDPALRSLHQSLSAQKKLRKVKPRANASFTIDTYFHFVVSEDAAAYYTADVLASLETAQYAALNTAYASVGMTFIPHTSTFTANTTWATNADEQSMKSSLRQGTYSSLNLYFQSHLSSPGAANDPSSFLLGYCELPTSVTHTTCSSASSTTGCTTHTSPPTEYTTDGCNILLSSMPGGGMQTYDQGKTAVHEVGHWFGLLHTFQDNSCEVGDAGDFIDDTPQESVSTDGCPTGKDSCPGIKGLDPIGNYMDYSSDACYTGFSPLQAERMVDLWRGMRMGA